MFLFANPTRAAWQASALYALGFALIAVPFGMLTGFYRISAPGPVDEVLRAAAIAFVLPAICEELVFRGPLVWWQRQKGRVPIGVLAVSLIAFVLWHPLNAFTFMPQAAPVFLDWRFLLIAALLGLVATAMTLRARSLWPAILFHWALVVGWKAMLGAPGFL